MPDRRLSSIKLVQLPIPEVHDLYNEGNIPLAAGYLKAFAVKKQRIREEDMEIIPRNTAKYAGDAAVLKWLTQEKTAVVGFTSYMWNINRNIYLAQKIKETNPEITVVFGGPEIDFQHRALNDKHIDALFIGEGEQAFTDFLEDYKSGAPLKRVYRPDAPLDLSEVPNPYLEKVLFPYKKESIFLETMRGCPYHCKYCFYSKSFQGLRFFPEAYLSAMFELARDYNVPEIYLMDPSFNVTPGLKERLEQIRQVNTTRIPVHTEMRLESVTPEIAGLMEQAGFRSVEAGLQSVNDKSLAAIGRTWNRKKFVNGAKLLQDHHIDVKTGVILGLPYDTRADVEGTVDFVMGLNLHESMEIYPLSLIPGTLLRDEAGSHGLTYMPHPPYWVLSTGCMGEKDIKNAVEMIEQKLEIEFSPSIIPRFGNFDPGYLHFLDLREKPGCHPDILPQFREGVGQRQVGHSLTLLIGPGTNIDKIREFGRWLKQTNPFTLVQIVMDRDSVPPWEEIRAISDAFYTPGHYFDHIHRFKIDSQGQYSVRFFHLTSDLAAAESYLYEPRYCDLVLRYTPQLLKKGREILAEKPVLLVDSPIGDSELTGLRQIYNGFENFLVLKL